jgi:hypothetical protein
MGGVELACMQTVDMQVVLPHTGEKSYTATLGRYKFRQQH